MENKKYTDEIFEKMNVANIDLNNAKRDFPESLFFDIEPPHQIFAKAFNIDDFKMAEKLVKLMYDDNLNLDKQHYDDYLKKMQNIDGQIELYFKCFHEGEVITVKYIKRLIKLWLKQNGIITFDPKAQKSYVENFLKSSKLSFESKVSQDSFTNLFNDPPLNKLKEVFKKNVDKILNQLNDK